MTQSSFNSTILSSQSSLPGSQMNLSQISFKKNTGFLPSSGAPLGLNIKNMGGLAFDGQSKID